MTGDSRYRGPSNPIEWLLYYSGALLMLGITFSVCYAVVMRYFFNQPPIWSEDIPKLMFVWMVFLMGGLAIKMGMNIRVTTLVSKLPRVPRLALELVMHVLVLIFLAVLFWNSFPVIRLGMLGTMISTGWSNAVFSVPIAVGAAIMFFYQARLLALTALALLRGEDGGGGDPEDPASRSQAGLG